MALGRIFSVQVGQPQLETFKGKAIHTAINKQKTAVGVLSRAGFSGDGQADLKHHGGADRAVCLYPLEHYKRWESLYSRSLPVPAFGENLTVEGMKEEDVFLGDIYQAGSARIQITEGRIPCAVISQFNAEPTLLKEVFQTGLTGYFARVLTEGEIEAGQEAVLLERQQDTFSVLDGIRIMLHGSAGEDQLKALLSIESLSGGWKEKLLKKLS